MQRCSKTLRQEEKDFSPLLWLHNLQVTYSSESCPSQMYGLGHSQGLFCKLEMELSHDPGISLLGINPQNLETFIH